MCLLVLAWQAHPRYRLIVAANRDEFHARPTAPMALWQGAPSILAGRDLSALGTWLAVDRQRRFGIITNYRDLQPRRPDAPTRGGLIPDWLAQATTPPTFLDRLESQSPRYAGFNLLLSDADSLWYASNRAVPFARALDPGVYGLSNLLLDTPWPKLKRVRATFTGWLSEQTAATSARNGPPRTDASEQLFGMLGDRRRGPPDTPAATHPLAPEWADILSSPFVVHPVFGTRCSTLAMIGYDGSVYLEERRFDADGTMTGHSHWSLSPGEWPAAADA
ncbi:MAG TPA: NRDE family protein [Steroidobacteraceae bacterium]|jgi:uncharacterized protein with NRDE domain|nr:NRDE family protein [Steroidobacteraceae bacterium]